MLCIARIRLIALSAWRRSCSHRRRLPRRSKLSGTVRDETGATLPGVLVELRSGTAAVGRPTATSAASIGSTRSRPAGSRSRSRSSTSRRSGGSVAVGATTLTVDAVMHLVLSADVTVTGKSTFTNLADAPAPAQDLVGIAQSASQGAITARQLETRPIMRPGEVLETVPGVVISQHSGEGKANQYYLRGFNLDHGTDFATTVAGMPVNMPTHGHGHGYSDLNFLIPELASGVQFSKGPYFAEHGDFATAGTANINYTNTLARPIVRVGGGGDAFGRVLLAAAPARRHGARCSARIELEHSDGPWERPDDLRKVNGVVRYSRGDTPQRLVRDADGLSRDVELDGSDPRARDRRRADRTIRPGGCHRRRRVVSLQRLGRMAAQRTATPARGSPPTASSTTSISSRTSPTSWTTRSTAISSSRRITDS